MVKNILKILLLAVIFAFALLPAVFDNSVYGYLPVFLLVLILLLSFICLQIMKKSLRVTPDISGSECRRGKNVTICLNIANNGLLLCPRAETTILKTDHTRGTGSEKKTVLTLAPKGRHRIGFDMHMPHIGVYDIGIDRMKLYDFFGIFSRKVEIDGKFQVYVLPKIFPIETILSQEAVREEAPRERRKAVFGGTEYMGTRDYAPGDSMKSIHWKLSAKSDGYITRIFESNKEMDFTVVLDFAAEKQNSAEKAMDLYDAVIETALSLIEEIARTHTSYYLVYADRAAQVKRVTPKGREDDYALIRDFSVLKEDPGPEFPDAFGILEEDNRMSSRSPNILIVTSRITKALVQEILRTRRQGRTPELYIVIPDGFTQEEYETLRELLRQLGEAGVFYSFVKSVPEKK